jgi:hypothetical protein
MVREVLFKSSILFMVLGGLFIISAGLIYTIERAAANISGNIKAAGFMAGQLQGQTPIPKMPGFTDNFYVPLLTVLGIILLVLGTRKELK